MMSRFRLPGRLAAVGTAGLLATALAAMPAAASAPPTPHQAVTPIKHFVFLMQGGRTFDNYFGTYPGADGLRPGICQPLATGDPTGKCVKPFLLDNTERAPLGANATVVANQWDGGKMDGFVAAYQQQGRDGALAMGYYNANELPFYWEAAQNYVLFDHFFSSVKYGIRDNRSYWVSASPAPGGTGRIPAGGYGNLQTIFDRLQAAGVSWKFYVQGYNPTQTYQSASPASSETQTARVPLVDFRAVHPRPGARQPHRRTGPVLPGPGGGNAARGGLRGVFVRHRRALRAVHTGRPEPGQHDDNPAHGEPLLGQLGADVVI